MKKYKKTIVSFKYNCYLCYHVAKRFFHNGFRLIDLDVKLLIKLIT